MQLPPAITFRGGVPSPELEAEIRRRIDKLETYYRPIMGCRVLVEFVQRHHEAGNRYHVRIDVTVPGDEIVVAHEGGLHSTVQDTGAMKTTKQAESARERKHARVAVREAFDVARRRLQDFARRQRGAVKIAARQARGRVVRLFPSEGYGFLEAEDGHEVYFQKSSVLSDAFDRLTVGAEVSFAEEGGEQGPQASTVKIARPRRRRMPVSAAIAICLLVLSGVMAAADQAQRRGRARPAVRGGIVFVGGYFYDPFFGPYPWWPRPAYPYPYFPIYDSTAQVRLLVVPPEAAVYVDGFYAGIVDDFDGVFQRLPLPPGGHDIQLHIDGYRTMRRSVYLTAGSTFKLEVAMEPLAAGERSEPPAVAPPVPPPPVGTYHAPRPRGTRPLPSLPAPPPTAGADRGTLAIRVQPPNADVRIDGQRWASSDGEHFVIELAVGPHRVEVSKGGYVPFSTEIHVGDDETTPLNVSLSPERP